MRPYIARVCGFARGEAKCKTKNECNNFIWGIMHESGIQYLTCCTLETTFLLATLILPEVKICASTRTCMHAYRNMNYAPIYPTLIDQSNELAMM